MNLSLSRAALCATAVLIAACGGGDKASAPEPSAKPAATAAAAAPPPAATSAAKPAEAKPAATPAPAATAAPSAEPSAHASAEAAATGPGGRSAVPKTEEWDAAREVTVTGSTKLGCETKMVREWLRVSCRQDKPKDPMPEDVDVTKGGGKGQTFTFKGKGVTSLVLPFVENTDIEAMFKWKGQRWKLVVSWPRGAPKPQAAGKFTKA